MGGDNLELASSQSQHRTQLEMKLQQFEKLSFLVIHCAVTDASKDEGLG